ncbi:MAG: Rrf2 family transcriptional regulator [Phycisphaerae bacterium]
MLALTKKTDYALIALAHLAQSGATTATARGIAERYHIPAALLMNVLKALSARGVVRSVRGAKGGYALAVRPDEYTLFDLIMAVEGPVRFVQCAGGEPSPARGVCELLGSCPVSRPARRVHDRLERFLREITLAELSDAPLCCGPEVAVPVPLRTGAMEART